MKQSKGSKFLSHNPIMKGKFQVRNSGERRAVPEMSPLGKMYFQQHYLMILAIIRDEGRIFLEDSGWNHWYEFVILFYGKIVHVDKIPR